MVKDPQDPRNYPLLTEKKNEPPKNWELCLIQWTFWGLQAQGTRLSDHSEGLLLRGKGGARIYRSFLQQRLGNRDIKRLLLMKENQVSQVNEFSAFLCMGRCWSLGSLKYSFDVHLSYLGPVSCAFSSRMSSGCTTGGSFRHPVSMLSSLRAPCRGGSNVMAWWL